MHWQKDVPPGHIAEIITHLEMLRPPAPAPGLLETLPFSLRRWQQPELDKYLTLFRRIGEPWLWQSRLRQSRERVVADIEDMRVEIHAIIDRRGIEVGMIELDFRALPDCEIVYFGLIAQLTGKGLGRWLMQQAQQLGWRKGVERLWLHTCSLDHPAAPGFYRKCGFIPFHQELVISPDPRLEGLYPRDAAPHIPIIETGQGRQD